MKKLSLFLLVLFHINSNSIILAQNFWQHSGLTTGQVESIVISTSGSILAGTEEPGNIFLSTNNGSDWSQQYSGFDVVSLALSPNSILFAGTENSGIFKSNDNGMTWVQSGLSGNISVYSIVINQSNHVFAGRFSQGISRSTDGGDTWTLVSTGLPSAPIYSLVINSNQNIYAGTDGFGVYKSNNNGDDWIQSGLPNTFIKSLLINNLGYIFVGSDSGRIFRSTDDGVSWTLNHSGLSTSLVHCLAMNISNGTLFEGTWNNGVFYSTDNGNNWVQENNGLTDLRVRSFGITSDGFLFAGTRGSGIFRSINSTTFVEDGNITNLSFSLKQNYPNPFNPSTKLNYSVPGISNVVIKVFDILGNEIETLVNDEKAAGNYEITWYAENLPSGVYFYQLRAGDFVETKKMILL